MSTWDSRHNFKIPRWGFSAADVDAGNSTEPSSGQKDVGWVPNEDSVNGRWWNWVWQNGAYWMTYAESIWARRWDEPQVMRSAKGTGAGAVTAGTGLSVNVAACPVWIDGAMYEAPAATNLALATADPTNPRDDLIVAQLDGGVPEFAVITGTPSPSTPDPTPGAGQVPIALVRVGAGATTPGAITDRRVFGVIGVDRAEVSSILHVGDDGRTLDVRDNGGASPSLTLFGDVTGLATVQVLNGSGDNELTWLLGSGPFGLDLPGACNVTSATDVVVTAGDDVTVNAADDITVTATDDITITAGGTLTISPPSFAAAVEQRIELTMDAFRQLGNGTAQVLGNEETDAPAWRRDAPGLAYLRANITPPIGATITEVRVWGTKDQTDAYARSRLIAITKTTNTRTDVFSTDNDGDAAGDFVLTRTGLSKLVASGEGLFLEIALEGGTSGTVDVWAAEVKYTFDELAGNA